MKFDIPFFIYEMPTKEYWKSVYPENGFQAKLAFLAARKAYWRTILSERQNHRCCYCGTRMNDAQPGETSRKSNTSTVDHIIPKSKGGPDHHDNYVIACYRCNSARGDQDAFKFAERMGQGRAQDCHGRMLKDNPSNTAKMALRKKLKDLGIKVNNGTKPCKLRKKLEKVTIRNMIINNIPNPYDSNTREHKIYERYSNPNYVEYERKAA